MTINAALRLMAGTVILLSLWLSYSQTQTWLYLTGFVGLNLLQSGFTRWCPAVTLFKLLGLQAQTCTTVGKDVNQGVHIIAGSLVTITVAAALFTGVPQTVLVVTAIIGASLLQSAFSGWCPAFTLARLAGCKDNQSAA